jgi:benzoyl-CoA reductase subunit BamC
VACSAFHAQPKYSSNNPARSRVRVIRRPLEDVYVPVYAGEYAPAECMGRNTYTLEGKEYEECAFCRAACPSRDLFKEPDSGLPLKCDMCEDIPEVDEPLCVKWCGVDALIYEEREVEVEEDEEKDEKVKVGEIELGLDTMVERYGLQKVKDVIAQKFKKA